MTTRLVDAVLERLETSDIGFDKTHEFLCNLVSTFYPEYFKSDKDIALRIQIIGLLQAYLSGDQTPREVARQIADIIDHAAARDSRLFDLIRPYQ